MQSKKTKTTGSVNNTALQIELENVEKEMEEMGGLATYQHMSSIGQSEDRGGGSEKVLIGWLKELGLYVAHKSRRGMKGAECKGKAKEDDRLRYVA